MITQHFTQLSDENQLKFLKKLKLIITEDLNLHEIPSLKGLNNRYFPYLEELILEFGTEWTSCDFSFLERHNNPQKLELHSRGTVCAENISSAKFPSLKVLVLNCDVFDTDKMSLHEKLNMEVPMKFHSLI